MLAVKVQRWRLRRTTQAIHNRRAESLIRNLFCNDKIDVEERVEFAQVTKQIRGSFAEILLLA